MEHDSEATLAWIRVGGVAGILAIVRYLAAAFAPLPDVAGYLAAFAFGPLVAVGSVGLRALLGLDRRGPLVDVAALFGVAAGVTVLIMLTVQQSIFALSARALAAAGEGPDAAAIRGVREGLNSIHLGIDVACRIGRRRRRGAHRCRPRRRRRRAGVTVRYPGAAGGRRHPHHRRAGRESARRRGRGRTCR